ncbi:chemotaxis protein CheW [Gracilibacillus sp. YIM 98692]|uniref:chemotaxis protein CheW n=1 Tax=Gracilibacillus sp. YIM 98692 TaxID=2663532 RepID=UPI0013D88D1B|nr:chemotaxis protein CheW [Gracilibacillus sp. YIM 98692]
MNQKSIVFLLDEKEYAVPVEYVIAIERMQQITRVPKTPQYVQGVINLRGVVTPIIDLRERFGLIKGEETDSTRMIIIQYDKFNVGFIVDAAYDVMDIPNDAIEPAPKVIGTEEIDYINGVAKVDQRLIMLLQLNKVLSDSSAKNSAETEGLTQG